MISIVFLISVFLAGILSFFSPCILPLLPVYVGILLDTDEPRTITIFGKKIAWYGIIKTLFFIAGLSVVFLILGYGAGFLGKVLYTEWFRYVLGAIVILLGVHQMELINFKLLQRQKSVQLKKDKNRNDFYNAFLLGVTFSLGWTPCVGPVLSSVLAIAASGGNGAVPHVNLYPWSFYPISHFGTCLFYCFTPFRENKTLYGTTKENWRVTYHLDGNFTYAGKS